MSRHRLPAHILLEILLGGIVKVAQIATDRHLHTVREAGGRGIALARERAIDRSACTLTSIETTVDTVVCSSPQIVQPSAATELSLSHVSMSPSPIGTDSGPVLPLKRRAPTMSLSQVASVSKDDADTVMGFRALTVQEALLAYCVPTVRTHEPPCTSSQNESPGARGRHTRQPRPHVHTSARQLSCCEMGQGLGRLPRWDGKHERAVHGAVRSYEGRGFGLTADDAPQWSGRRAGRG